MPNPNIAITQHRSLFLSDLHLGALGARSDLVLQFLEQNHAETYVLVGDIYDMHPGFLHFWTPAAQAVVDHLRARHLDGAKLVYVVGNHDRSPQTLPASMQLPVHPVAHAVYQAGDGQSYLVLHGDAQDNRLFQLHALTRLGSIADQTLRIADLWIEQTFPNRRFLHKQPGRRSALEYVLSCVNASFYMLRGHERRLVAMARALGYDGVICGHFHIASLHNRHGLTYANCGDWMDSFTALVSNADGQLSLLGGREAIAAQAKAKVIRQTDLVLS